MSIRGYTRDNAVCHIKKSFMSFGEGYYFHSFLKLKDKIVSKFGIWTKSNFKISTC